MHGGHLHDLALLDAVVRVGPAEPRGLQQVDDLRLGDVLAVEVVLVLLEPDRAPQADLLAVHREAVVGVVEDDLGVRGHDRVPGALVQELLALLRAGGAEDVGEDESDGVEQVGLTRTIRADCSGRRVGTRGGASGRERRAGRVLFKAGRLSGEGCAHGKDLGVAAHRCS